MAKLVIEIGVDDSVVEDLERTIDYMLDAGTIQDAIREHYEDRLEAGLEIETITCYQTYEAS